MKSHHLWADDPLATRKEKALGLVPGTDTRLASRRWLQRLVISLPYYKIVQAPVRLFLRGSLDCSSGRFARIAS